MELSNMKLLIFLIIHNIGLTLQQQQSQAQDYYFGQPQGRFIPSYQNSRNNYYNDPAQTTRNQQAGSYQEQTLFVNPQTNGRPQLGNQDTIKPSYYHFQQFPTTHHPNFYEISPRPFSITPSNNAGFQFTRAGAVAAAQKNNYYQTNNFNRNGPKTQTIDSYLDELEGVQPQLVDTYISHRQPQRQQQQTASNPATSGNNLKTSNNFKPSSTFNDYYSSHEDTTRSANGNNRVRNNYNSIGTTPLARRPSKNTTPTSTSTATTEAPIITTRRNNNRHHNVAAVRTTTSAPILPSSTVKTTRSPKTYAPRQWFTTTSDSVEARTTLSRLAVRPLSRNNEPETTPKINVIHNGSETLTEALNERSSESLLDHEAKHETIQQNNVLPGDDTEYEYYEEDDKHVDHKPVLDQNTVILTDNFFLPGKPEESPDTEEAEEPKIVKADDSNEAAEQLDVSSPAGEVEIEEPKPTIDAPVAEITEDKVTSTTTSATTTTTTTTTEAPKSKEDLDRKSIPVVEYEYEYEYEDETVSPPKKSEDLKMAPAPQQDFETSEEVDDDEDEIKVEPESAPGHTVLGGSVVSVVTTKSVVNGTIMNDTDIRQPTDGSNSTTESWVVVASVQTSRSISGARFLPFPNVNQAEKKQVLKNAEFEDENSSDLDDADIILRPTTEMSHGDQENVPSSSSESVVVNHSTESIIDKLDRVQSELSVGVLSGKFPVLKEMTTEETEPKSNKAPPVFIRKFTPKAQTTKATKFAITTTSAPVSKTPDSRKISYETVEDDVSALLPPGFKLRNNYKLKKPITTTTEAFQEADDEPSVKPEMGKLRNFTIGRSVKTHAPSQEIGSLSKDHKSSSEKGGDKDVSDILSKIKFQDALELSRNPSGIDINDDISKFLPPGYKPPKTTERSTKKALPVIPISDSINKFLPPGYKPPADAEDSDTPLAGIPIAADISNLLPPGYKLPNNKEKETGEDAGSLLNKIKFKVAMNKTVKEEEAPQTPEASKPSAGNSGFKVVFPSRPGAGNNPKRLTTPRTHVVGVTQSGFELSIRKGPPTRATTEFTGWPSPPTTPLSIEKLLEQQRAATFDISSLLSSTTPRPKTTTTPPTTTTPRPTEPGICRSDCDLAGTIRIVDGVNWTPELLDHYTDEWKNLANDVETQLNEVYSNARQLSRWYKKVRIDSFSKGSVLVDYFVELKNITHDVNTQQIKQMFHDALVPTILRDPTMSSTTEEGPIAQDLGADEDYPADSIHTWNEKGRPALALGRFIVDPISTDFIVIPHQIQPTMLPPDPDLLLPQWAIAVICIGFISLMFVIVFGVTVVTRRHLQMTASLVNRQKAAKKKSPTPLTADMLNELNKNHMGGLENYGNEDLYNVDDTWDDRLEQGIKPKRFSSSMHGSSASNIYDSWRSQHGRHGGDDYFYDSHDNYLNGGYKTKERDPSLFMMHEPYPQVYPSQFSQNNQQFYNQSNQSNHSNSNRRYYRDYDPNF